MCSLCGAQIAKNKANLERHERIHKPTTKKIKCSAENCISTFKQKSDYYRHWSRNHNNKIMPDRFDYVTEENLKYKLKYTKTRVTSDTNANKCNDFQILNYLGLFENRGDSVKLNYPYPEPFFGKIVFNDSDN